MVMKKQEWFDTMYFMIMLTMLFGYGLMENQSNCNIDYVLYDCEKDIFTTL